MHENLTALPEQIVSGTAYDFTLTYAEFPANEWTLKLLIAGPGFLSIDADVDGLSFAVALTNANTAGIPPGNYVWEYRVTKGGKSYVADSGVLEVLPNLAVATPGSLQSFNSKALAAVEAAISIRLGIGGTAVDVIESYSVGSRNIMKMSLRDLYDLRASLRMAVRNEARPGRLGPQVRAAFTGVGAESGLPPWTSGE